MKRPYATPLTTLPGREVQSSLSPDGNQVAFSYDGDPASNFDIYVKSIGSEQMTRLTWDAADDLSPSWSPDGLNIAFLRFLSDQSAAVMIVPAAGGVERQLAKIEVERYEPEIRLSWSPDGHWLATSDKETTLSRLKLVLISASTGVKRRLRYRPEPDDADLDPVISPDGRYIAFARHTSVSVAEIYLLKLPTESDPEPTARPLTLWRRLNKSPVWRSNNDLLFVGDEGQIGSRIWELPVFGGGSPHRLEGIGEDSTSVTCTRQKDRLVYSRETRDLNIWKLDLHETAERPDKQAVVARLIASTREDEQPEYSPDGKRIAFRSDRSGQYDIWLANSDGSEARQITRMAAIMTAYGRWSPDGRSLVFHSRLNGYANLYILDIETGGYRPLTTGSTNDSAASWSPDNKWIFFESERSGIPQIWKIPAAGGPASQVTRNGAAVALPSPDGKMLVYSKFNAPGLWMLPFTGRDEVQLAPAISTIDSFAVTKTGVYLAHPTPNREVSIAFLSFEDRTTQELARLKVPACYGLSVSPDQRSILYAQTDHLASDLILVDHFN